MEPFYTGLRGLILFPSGRSRFITTCANQSSHGLRVLHKWHTSCRRRLLSQRFRAESRTYIQSYPYDFSFKSIAASTTTTVTLAWRSHGKLVSCVSVYYPSTCSRSTSTRYSIWVTGWSQCPDNYMLRKELFYYHRLLRSKAF